VCGRPESHSTPALLRWRGVRIRCGPRRTRRGWDEILAIRPDDSLLQQEAAIRTPLGCLHNCKRLPRSLIEGEKLQGNKLDRAAAGQPNGHHPRSAYQLWRGGLYLCAPTAPCAFACTSAPSGGRATPGEGDMWARGSETNASIGSTEVMASSVSGPLQPANTTTARRGHPQ
jgi:hypothetical protein